MKLCSSDNHYTTIWYRNQTIDLQSYSMDWFLYDTDLRHEKFNVYALVYDFRLHTLFSILFILDSNPFNV